jgi:hypothetical protein
VYFAGPETVESVPTGGGAATVWFTSTTPNRIVTVAAAPYGSNTMVAWGLQDTTASFLLTGVTLGIKRADGFLPTSLAPAGGEAFEYVACAASSCELNGTGNTIAANAFGLDIDNSQPNTSIAFWGDSAGVHRYATPIIF